MSLEQRGKSLEEAYFHRVNQKLADELKKSASDEAARKDLAVATGLGDEELLQKLVDQGVSAETLIAFSLVPAVAVAWADGRLDKKESAEILAHTEGVEKDGVSGRLLNAWLSEKPSSELFDAWKSFTKTMLENQDEASRKSLRDSLMSRCTAVAKANGGTLGFGSISPSEKKMLDEIEDVLKER